MADETTDTRPEQTEPGAPQLADMTAVAELARHLGQILSNMALYGPQHKVSQQAIMNGYEFLGGFFAKWERVSFTVADNMLLADGRQIESKNTLMLGLIKQLSAIDVGSFSLARGVTFIDFTKLTELLNTPPEKMKAMGSFSEALSKSGVSHVQAKSVVYQLVTEEDVVVNKEELQEALSGGGEGEGGKGAKSVEEIIAFLKGTAGQFSLDIEEASSDTHKLADMILKASEVSPEKAEAESAKTLGEVIVGCLKRAYQSLLQDPAAKTQQGKKTLVKTLMQLQDELLQGLRELVGPAADQIAEMVGDAVEQMTNELQVDALASDYAKKRKGIETTEKRILKFMKAADQENPEATVALKDKLMESGLDALDWQELLVKNVEAAMKKAGGGEAGAEVLNNLVSQMNTLLDPAKVAAGKAPEDQQVTQLVTQLEQEVATVTAEATQKLDQLEKRLRDRPDMSREAMLAMLAEIGQEICQPLSVINCSIDMIRGKSLGEITAMQKEMLDLAAESGARVETLANKIIEISGVPKGTKPDSEILDDVYGR